MVTISEARTGLTQQRTALESQRQQIQQTRLPALTAAQLRQQTRTGLAQRRVQGQQLERRKSRALETLKPFEAELTSFESQIVSVEREIQQAEKQRSDFEAAKKLFQRGIIDPAASAGIKKFLRDFEAGRESLIIQQIEAQLFTPIPELLFTPLPPQFTPLPPTFTPLPPPLFTPIPPEIKREIRIPQISKQNFETILDKFQKQLPIEIKIIREIGVPLIEKAKVKALVFTFPFFRKELNLVNRENQRLQNEFNKLNISINKFNVDFGGVGLNESQFKLAESQKITLDKNIEDFVKLQDEIEFNRTERLDERQGLFFKEAVQSIGVGAVSLPFDITKLIISGITQPIQTGREVVAGIKVFPEQLSVQPATVIGQVAGQAIVFGLLRGLTSKATLIRSKNIFIFERTISPAKIRKTPLSETFKTEVEFKINDNQIKSFAIRELNKKGVQFGTLSEIEQNFITGQIKAKIINNPELFIPQVRRLALQRQGIRNIKLAIQQRLEARADPLVVFDKAGRAREVKPLSNIQRLSLQRLQETLEKQRIKTAIEKPTPKPFDLLTTTQKDFIVNQIKARVKVDPTLTLTKTQRIALERVRTRTELLDLREAILSGLEPKKIGDLLSTSQRRFIKSQIEAELRANPVKYIPKARLLALKRLQKLQEKKAIDLAIQKGSKNLKLSDLISKQDKDFIKSQIQSQVKADPTRFVPSQARQILLQRLKKPEPKPVVIKIVSGELSSVQLLLLKRLKQIGKIKPKPLVPKVEPKVIGIPKPPIIRKPKTSQALRQELKQVQKQSTKETSRLKQVQASKQKTRNDLRTKLVSLQRRRSRVAFFGTESQELLGQQQQVTQKLVQVQREISTTQLQFNTFSRLTAQGIRLKQLELQRFAELEKITPKLVTPLKPIPLIKKKKKVKIKVKELPLVTKGKFTIFVRKKQKDIRFKAFKSKKKSRVILKKTLATTLRASGFIVDPKGKKLKPKITKGFRISKIDPFRIVERRGRRLDTKSETSALVRARRIKLKSTPMIKIK